MGMINAVFQAYSDRNDAGLVTALKALSNKLVHDVQNLGSSAVAFQLREYPGLSGVIRKIGSDASATSNGELAHLAGYVSAYISLITQAVERESVDLTEAKLSVGRDKKGSIDLITMILKTTFAHSGVRATDLVNGIARSAKVSPHVVKRHVLKLVSLGMLECPTGGPKASVYRTSYLGGEILARRTKPYELALFLVDEAAQHEGLRAAMRDEIRRTWPN